MDRASRERSLVESTILHDRTHVSDIIPEGNIDFRRISERNICRILNLRMIGLHFLKETLHFLKNKNT